MGIQSNEQLLLEFYALIPFVQTLETLQTEHWDRPVSAGKWTIKDIICHIMMWDKYFYEEAVVKVASGQPVTARQLDFNEFNASSRLYAQLLTVQEVVEKFYLYRNRIIDTAASLDDEAFSREHKDGDHQKFSIRNYLRDFIPHDKHHRKQIEKCIKSQL
ncbi:DinB family protein [Paenibacillus albidus]|uniref:DinB family protein n=1 Tax=Paenibacillus albidus TaxID=2041023 RepID=UPI001BEAD7D7|nr:DinB family protein [Paenibacillus albidus]MBT2292952.1 DinB family protein [Paenibacillus albidus]